MPNSLSYLLILLARSVMIGNITVEGKPIKDVLEMKKHDEIISTIMKIGKGDLNISESRIRDIHKGIMHEEDSEKRKQIGIWKKEASYLHNYKKERFDFALPSEVPERMHKLINWLNTEKEKIDTGSKKALHPALLAFQFHLDYVTIHPFYDGNGRAARIFTNLILISYGLPPICIKENEKGPYYQYLADIQGYGGNPDLFYDFMTDLLIRSLQIMIDAIEGKDIEEVDDWEKKLILLKQELSGEPDVKIEKNITSIEELLSASVLPFIKKLMDKIQVFDDLFANKALWFGSKSRGNSITNFNQIKEIAFSPGERVLLENTIHLPINFRDLKKMELMHFM